MERGERYSTNVDGMLSGRTVVLGLNFSASALGVSSVWMKIVLRDCVGCRSAVCARGWVVGLCRWREEDIGVVRELSEKYRGVVASRWTLVALVVVDGREIAFVRLRIAGLLAMTALIEWCPDARVVYEILGQEV